MSFSEFTQQDYDIIDKEYQSLVELARKRCPDEKEFAVIQKAFDFANEAHKNVRRRSGEPYMIHPVEVAKIVIEKINLGYKSISAALLHDVVEDTDYTVEDIRNLFGDKIASLVDGLTKIKTVLDNEDRNKQANMFTESLQAENLKRILLTLNDDVRVVLIKLADRLHNCRTIEFMKEHKRDKILSETMFIFIPLAHRLGLYEVKSEMENIWLKYKEPEAYRSLSARISESVKQKGHQIDSFVAPIEDALKKAGFDFYIKKRIKTPYSVWRKMRTKSVDFDQIYDLYAVRIIFNPPEASTDTERDLCFRIYSIITGIYRYNEERTRDWVRHPKSNGYEALHCTLMSQMGIWIEVQIRSKRMDDIAEKGIAAHWAYKKEGYVGENDSEMDKWLAKVAELLQSKDINSMELLDIIHQDLVTSNIVVFTPKGDQKSIQKGATALDLAYLIHTHIGHQAIAAKVNMKLVPLSHQLRSGDQVEIVTAQSGKPKREWLQFLKTRHARNLVIEFFKGQKEEIAEEGGKRLREHVHSMGKNLTHSLLHKLLVQNQLSGIDELYFRYGLGLIGPDDVSAVINNRFMKKARYDGKYVIRPNGAHKYIIAGCCYPIPGDPVVGFLSPDGQTVEVHKKSCKVAESLASKHGDWMVTPHWENQSESQDFPVRVLLKGIDRIGLLNDITQVLSSSMGLNMRKVYLNTDGEIFDGYIEFYVRDLSRLEETISMLSGIDGIQNVARTDI